MWFIIILLYVVPAPTRGQDCTVEDAVHADGSKWTDDFWQFECTSGKFSIIGCRTSPSGNGTIVPVNQSLVVNQLWRNCSHNNGIYKYQEGIECKDSNRYRSGHFELKCDSETGRAISGCMYREGTAGRWVPLAIGESRVENNRNHSCFRDAERPERIHYANQATGCEHQGAFHMFGDVWRDENFEFQCQRAKGVVVKGTERACCIGDVTTCVTHIILAENVQLRCTQINGVTLYQQNAEGSGGDRPCRFKLGAFDITCRNRTRTFTQ